MKIIEVDVSEPWYHWLTKLEKRVIQEELDSNGYSITNAAKALCLNSSTLHEKIKKLGIKRRSEAQEGDLRLKQNRRPYESKSKNQSKKSTS